MKTSTILGATAALFLGNAMADVTIQAMPSLPSLPSLPSISIPSFTIPTTLPSCIPVPQIPTTLPFLPRPSAEAEEDMKRDVQVKDEFERMHPRQMTPMEEMEMED
ncbi:uncharacterized protein BDV17DRAFT_291635 [Aspergillus undulatus]|uniref:uncharacterized protein n=1 Tax=Aspergillus undulatus TaxID=1810928 RepID=UPI003CCCED8F